MFYKSWHNCAVKHVLKVVVISFFIKIQLETVDQWSTRIPRKAEMGITGQYMDCNWTSFKNHKPSIYQYMQEMCCRSLDLKFKAKLKLESANQKIQYCHQAAILKMTYLKINRLFSLHTSNVLLKFGLDIQNQTEVRVRKPKNSRWPPGGHFESDIAENQ